jgi:flagellar motor switch protein FliN/FliY
MSDDSTLEKALGDLEAPESENEAEAPAAGGELAEAASVDQAIEPAEDKAKPDGKKNVPDDLEFILDIPLRVSVELGRTKMLVNDLLQLGQGSVIELTKLAGESMEVYVNDKLIARGEVVVVNEKFGVRLTDIISPQERIEQLA